MNECSEIELKNFFIFNSSYGSKEGEEYKKLLYYYPSFEDTNTQANNVGLVEAIIKFTWNFKPTFPVNALHTQKKRQLYLQPEEHFWMVMNYLQTLNLPTANKSKDGLDSYEYFEDDVQDNVYEAVLKQAYLMYKLFSGPYQDTVDKTDIATLKQKLEHFFTAYLKTLKLTHCDILNIFAGIHYLPLNNQTFLNVQSFINFLECNYPIIESVSFLFNESLIWSGIEPEDMQTIYQYLLGTLLPATLENEIQGGSMPRHASTPFAPMHYGRFLTGPSNLKTNAFAGKPPKVYLGRDSNRAVYYLIVYRALNSTLCLFLNEKHDLTLNMFKELDEFIGPQLTTISSDIAEYCSRYIAPTNVTENIPRFIYFNKLNLAYKSTVHLDTRQAGNVATTKESVKIMGDMNSNKHYLGDAGEIIVKTMNDYWIVGKLSGQREFYVALQQKSASLIDISDEVKRICDTELKGIFFQTT